MEAALSDVIQFEEALGNITDKPMDSNNLVSVKVDVFEESPYFFKCWHRLNMNSIIIRCVLGCLTVAINELLCMKNAGTQIAIDFS